MKLLKSDADSGLLGAPVCCVKLNKITPAILRSIHEKTVKQNYAVAFITAENINLPDLGNFSWKGLVLSEFKMLLRHGLLPMDEPTHPEFYVNTAIRDEDTSRVYDLITGLHTTSRFYHDKMLPRAYSKKVYRRWADESLAGNWADKIYYLRNRSNDEIIGLITSQKRSDELVRSVLVVVDSKSQGKGAGSFLMKCVHCGYFQDGFKESIITTQYNNANALAYYGKLGYRFDSMLAEFHLYNKKFKLK